ncbi:MAG: hypothetical protein BGP16_13255 [Sphingobium sp. 66-54]|nr:MAG: hypothetical protein BGP16_13255 [Sphingobium sp. 66-54]
MATNPDNRETDWPLRAWVFVILGGLIALAIQQLADLPDQDWEWGRRLVSAAILFLGVGGVAFGLAWERGRLLAAVIVALLCGLIASGSFIWNGVPNDGFGPDGWHLVCGVLASAFLLTLFQAGQDRAAGRPAQWSLAGLRAWRREAIHYPDVHGHLWTNALLLGLSGLFMLLALGIAHLLAEMFWLVKLDFLRVALRKDWFMALLLGGAFGAALGLLRDRGAIISALQRVAMLVLRVLAPVVAAAILVFLAALPFTGLAPLWSTGGTTPIMLAGAMLALFLANAVVGDRAEDESRSTVLGASAAALGLVLLPMVGIAAFSSGLRVQQYGLSPDRLWALTFIAVGGITAIAYAVAIIGPRGWFARLRRTNLRLVFVLAGIALVLSTPLLGFERIATAHQLARLASGRVSAEAFDYKALWFDYGPPGRAAIKRLAATSANPAVRAYATKAMKLENRWADAPNAAARETGTPLMRRLTILPAPVPLDEALRLRLLNYDACGVGSEACVLRYVPGQDYALVIRAPAETCAKCSETISLLRRVKTGWSGETAYLATGDDARTKAAAIRAGRIEMRPVERRQLFIDGKPAGEPIALENAAEP